MDTAFALAEQELRMEIQEGAPAVPRSLTLFAQQYAIVPELQDEALIAASRYSRTSEEAQKAGMRRELLGLVEQIVADHEAQAGSEAALVQRAETEKIERHFRAIPPPEGSVFTCEGLGKNYRKGGFTLQPLSLNLRLGEITGVVGGNANGKTTLFKLVAGELRHDRGTLAYPLLEGGPRKKIDWAAVKEQIAYVPQELPRWTDSLEDTLRYEAAIHGVLRQENDREVAYIVERLRLAEHLGKRWAELSGGYKLRFALARALVWKPKLFLIDEPLANLDFQAQLTVLRDLRDLANSLRHPMSVMISSQHLHEIEAVADNILFLKAGEAIFNGPISGMGRSRRCNTYELNCQLELEALTEALREIAENIYFNGLSFVITTPVELGHDAFLRYLLERGVEIEYFRDISRSIKQLFTPDDGK